MLEIRTLSASILLAALTLPVLGQDVRPNARQVKHLSAPAREELTREYAKVSKRHLREIADFLKSKKATIRREFAEKLVERRKHALEGIRDEVLYPDANHGASGQAEIDLRVDAVRAVYSKPLAGVLEGSEKTRKSYEAVLEASRRASEYLAEVPTVEQLELEINRAAAEILDLPSLVLDFADHKQKKEDERVATWNQKLRSQITDEEWACVQATNDYRRMMGLPALRIDMRLVAAARKHSKEMVQMGYFEHESPVGEHRTPEMRCKAEGATFSGENIYMGSLKGLDAFEGWYTSSGHHRNMVSDQHTTIGVGCFGNHFTQEFGSDKLD